MYKCLFFTCDKTTQKNFTLCKMKKNLTSFLTGKTASRSSRRKLFCKNGALKHFAKFTGKSLCQNIFFDKSAD